MGFVLKICLEYLKCRCWIKIACLAVVIAWIFTAYPWMWWTRYFNDVPPVSYDGRIQFNLDNLIVPETEQEIVNIVEEAYTSEPVKKIRVLGDGHSWSEIAQTPDIMISLAKYTGIIGEVNKDRLTATFRAGTPLNVMSEILQEKGYSMINLGSVAGQSIAGAISTGTHGTGLTVGNLADLVTALKFVSGTGEVISLSEDDENTTDLLRAAQVNIGMFGVLTEVTVRVKELFYLEENRTSQHDLDYCLDNIDKLANSATYVKLWVEFYHNFCILFQSEITDKHDVTTIPWWQGFLTYYSFAVTTRITYLLPFLTPYTNWLVDYIGFGIDTNRVDISYKIFNDYFNLPIHQEGEVIVPYKHAADTVRAIRDVILENKLPVNYITEVRFVKGDNIWLSPEYGTVPGSCAVTLTIYAKSEVALDYFNRVYEATLDEYNGRVHWGKHFTANATTIKEWYPKFTEFMIERKKLDPKGIFVNEFLEATFFESA